MTEPQIFLFFRADVDRWNAWRKEHPSEQIDLSHIDFTAARLSGINLRELDLSGIDFSFCTLAGADLSRTILDRANFSGADLPKAKLRGASLFQTIFAGTSLNGADLSKATLYETFFGDVDLSGTKGLESITHDAPSTIGIEAIYRSKGKIPETFLRNAGLTEEFIRLIPSLVDAQEGRPFYSCFISYSHQDEAFARRLFTRLREAKLRVWYAPENLKAGRKIHEQIEAAIRVQDKLLLLLSQASMQSEWVKTEIYHARQREQREGRQILFPVGLVPFKEIGQWQAFDADSGKDMAREIREYLIPDFTGWEEPARFETAFTRLLRDLQTDAPPPVVTQ